MILFSFKKSQLKKLLKSFVDFVFPQSCVLCSGAVELGSEYSLCCQCLKDINKTTFANAIYTNGECDSVYAPTEYVNSFKQKMIQYKFKNTKYLGKTFAFLIERMYVNTKITQCNNSDIIVIPVPIHFSRDRAYNQSAVIAYEFAKNLGLNYSDDILIKIKGIKALSSMSKSFKRVFIKNSFCVINSYKIVGKTVLLIDDIFTTGATADECATILKNNGAQKVIALCASYTPKLNKGEW